MVKANRNGTTATQTTNYDTQPTALRPPTTTSQSHQKAHNTTTKHPTTYRTTPHATPLPHTTMDKTTSLYQVHHTAPHRTTPHQQRTNNTSHHHTAPPHHNVPFVSFVSYQNSSHDKTNQVHDMCLQMYSNFNVKSSTKICRYITHHWVP